jgi:cell division protease FtsH
MSILRRLVGRLLSSPLGLPIRPGRMRLPVWLLFGGLACLVALAIVQSPPSRTVPAPERTTTYRVAWTLPELQQHIAAGDVVMLTASRDRVVVEGATGSGGSAADEAGAEPTLLARTKDGQDIPVDLSIDFKTAVDVLRLVGVERLLSAEVVQARVDPIAFMTPGSPVGPPVPNTALATALTLGAVTLLLGAGVLAVGRLSGATGQGRPTASFQTIVPHRRRRAAAGSSASDGVTELPELPRGLVRFRDVAGVEEAKLELAETVEFLRHPDRFAALGAQVPRGVLLYGPPGTGKTMLARAVAGEAGVPFTYASGSDFVEMFVGVGASRIRKLFSTAKGHGAGVIFIDEIDAVAKRRSGPNATGNDEREGTLNALLVEMDGFATSESLVVIAATNRLDILDPALLRPGRFGRKVHIGLPDKAARRSILAVHAAGKPLEEAVDLEAVARRTAGFSGAQLADLLNEAAIAAARRGASSVSVEDARTGWLKAAVGVSRRRSMNERERSIIAAHEAGHAICGRVWGEVRRVEEISLYQHGEALGVTVSSSDDNALPSERDLRAMLAALMGGRAAEALLFTEVTGGAANDFEQARGLARRMVRTWGLGRDPDTGLAGHALVSDEGELMTRSVQEAQVRAERAILDRAAIDARTTLLSQRQTLDRVSAYLFEQERIDGDEFAAVFEGRLQPEATVIGAWRAAASSPRSWDEIDAMADAHDAPAAVAPTPPPPLLPPIETPPGGSVPVPAAAARRAPRLLPAGLAAGIRLTQGILRMTTRARQVGRSVDQSPD